MQYSINEIVTIIGARREATADSLVQPATTPIVEHLLTDSRTLSFPETSLFFALKTGSNDGHKYIGDLYARGVRQFVVADALPAFGQMSDAVFLIVDDVLNALQTLAAHHRRRFSVPVVGITGSNGKTVVKELLYQLLRSDYNIARSPRSYNSQTGAPLSVWEMNETHTLGIFEAGVSQPDEMIRLQPVIAPTIGLLTNIGAAHQENFQSAEAKCVEKLTLFKDSDAIIYPADDPLIARALETAGLSRKATGWSRANPAAELYVENVVKHDDHTVLSFKASGVLHSVSVPFTDDAFLEDIIHCIAIMLYLNPLCIAGKEDVFASLEPVAMRLETKQGINGCQLINDAYNSDVNSLAVALDFQQSRRSGKQLKSTVILSDILQSGLSPEQLYEQVAELFRRKTVERVIGVGLEISCCADLFAGMETSFYHSTEAFINAFRPEMFRNEMILVKGSRSFHFERIIELLEKKMHETILEVNLDAVIRNFNYFRSQLAPSTKIVCMVKAFGYGVGSFELARTLEDHRCDYLAVAVADEGKDLRKEGISIPVMVMNPELGSLSQLFEYGLEPEVYSFRVLDALIKEATRRGVISFPTHIKIDTGMHRLGFEPSDVPEICRRIRSQSGLAVRSVFSHLAGGDSPELDDFTNKQLDTFQQAATELERGLGYSVLKHILNSAGIERFGRSQYDMVRLGIALYGVSASGVSARNLQCVCALKTVILQIRRVPAGDSIGYGRKTFVNRDSLIAVLPVGYADGLNRRLSNGVGEVLVGGKRCPIVGNICMDACMVDVTDADAREGDRVTVFDEHLTVSEIAGKIGAIPYEILTSISPRVKRVYYRE